MNIIPGNGSGMRIRHVQRDFEDYLKSLSMSEKTVMRRRYDIGLFEEFLREERIEDLRTVDNALIHCYLFWLGKKVGRRTKRPLSQASKVSAFVSLKKLFGYLYVNGRILTNPCRNVSLKAKDTRGSRIIFTKEEMACFLDAIDTTQALDLRDRALFELQYSSGLRSSEICALKKRDVDFDERLLLIRNGKWGKDRIVPASRVAIRFLKMYVQQLPQKQEEIFKGKNGVLSTSALNKRFQHHLKLQGKFERGMSAHMMRHACATHLLLNGADLRYVQELLGHESIETTVLYTHAMEEKLKNIYKTHHPRENEYFKEVDAEYLQRLNVLRQSILSRQKARENYWKNRKRYDASRKAPRKKKE